METLGIILAGAALLAVLGGIVLYFAICIWRGATGRWRLGAQDFQDDRQVPGVINVRYSSSREPFFRPQGLLKLLLAVAAFTIWVLYKSGSFSGLF
jgi:hypothetical protein